MVIIFLGMVITGVYLLLKFRFPRFTFIQIIGYSVLFLCFLFSLYYTRIYIRTPYQWNIHDPHFIAMFTDDNVFALLRGQREVLLREQEQLEELFRFGLNQPKLNPEEIIAKLDIVKNISDMQCGICFESFNDLEALSCPRCKKVAHKECLKEWFKEKALCIYCRYDFLSDG